MAAPISTLLAEVNQAHERLNGPAMRRIPQREWEVFGKREHQRSGRHLGFPKKQTALRSIKLKLFECLINTGDKSPVMAIQSTGFPLSRLTGVDGIRGRESDSTRWA